MKIKYNLLKNTKKIKICIMKNLGINLKVIPLPLQIKIKLRLNKNHYNLMISQRMRYMDKIFFKMLISLGTTLILVLIKKIYIINSKVNKNLKNKKE